MSLHDFAYAQARLQARHGARPQDGTWALLRASTSLGHFLESARTTPLRPWVARLSSQLRVADVEEVLRIEFAAHVMEVARWVPQRWYAATVWAARAPWLPWLDGTGWTLPENMTLPPGLEVAPASAWKSVWPAMFAHHRRGMLAVVEALEQHAQRMQDAAAEEDGWQVRRDLHRQLLGLFRAHTQQPATVFCHLGLTAIELQMLRGAWLHRALFPDTGRDTSWV